MTNRVTRANLRLPMVRTERTIVSALDRIGGEQLSRKMQVTCR